MDFNMKQWRNQQQNESEDQEPTHTAKLPKLVLDLEYSSATATASASDSSSALPLFVTEPNNKLPSSTYSDSTTTTVTKFPKMGSYFSMAQWQELELQALIYRHMIAGAPVPPELLHLVQKSLINNSSPYYFPQSVQQYHHYQQALLQSGYWGRTSMDPEPGRCRRTDGKKWRCSRDVVSGHKYCERHVHRGRNRSRKPVEVPTTAVPPGVNATTSDGGGGGVLKVNTNMASHASVVPQFSLSGTSPSSDIFRLNQRHPESTIEKNGPLDAQNDGSSDDRSSGQILRHFFDDWPRQQQECDNASSMTSATKLSISMPGNPSSDFSLKLSTGDRHISGYLVNNVERSTWRTNHVSSMGGPLAEALRSSTTNSSPTSVLHQLQRASTLEARYVST